MKNDKPTLFSGIQPSGTMHLGAYIGALKNWVKLQDDYHSIFSIVDLHAITTKQDPIEFKKRCYDLLALYIACGLDPNKNIFFCQSHVSAHAQLAWILNCNVYMGELSRMTQFKDKSQKTGANISAGLFVYPVLQAADILLYQTNLVPVGADQKQHLELARDIVLRFNNTYGPIFTLPEQYIPSTAEGGRIMGLLDPDKKMSKSDQNENNVIALLDKPEVIMKKLQRAVTDSGSEILYAKEKPGVSNLLTIFSAITGKKIEFIEAEYASSGYGKFKSDLAEIIIDFLNPIQKNFHDLREDKIALDMILKKGAQKAKKLANMTLKKVNEALGFIED